MVEFIQSNTNIFKVVGLVAEYQENKVIINAECETQWTKNGWGTQTFTVAKVFKDWRTQGNYTYFKGTDSEKEYKRVKPVIAAIWKWVASINGNTDNIFSFNETKLLEYTGIEDAEAKIRKYKRYIKAKEQAEQKAEPQEEKANNTPAPAEVVKVVNKVTCTASAKETQREPLKQLIISSVAYDTYKKEARNDNDLSRDIVERRLTAIANNADRIGQVGSKSVLKFGSFIMIVDEKRGRIETVTWRNTLHKGYRMPRERIQALKADYIRMGLNTSGNRLIKG